ncbi:MAG: carboxylesterase/lipase family protein [Acidimicrobiia bacterium]|nr:carboxylesterase/lipase family protein [Acidimicrobiia bacterium]
MEVAHTSSGALRGERCGPVVAFRGVPYAAPPVGDRRWRAPAPVPPWTGERDATRFGPIPPQDMSPERLAKRGVTMAEDCLSLNVWTPAVDGAARPVVVFLHGGGVVAGAGSAPLFDGARLAERGDVVVVTVNFRLGALGSLYAPDRLGTRDDLATNLAFRDQIRALRWVRAEIAAFGGDPGCVTVMGQSSGAVAIACMLAGDAARGSFDRAILQSGGLERVRSTEAAADVARQFFAALGAEEPFDRLAPTVEEIVAAQGVIPTGFVPPVGPFHHAIDGDVIPEHPLVAAATRPLLPVPILAGTTRDEWRAFDTVLTDDEVTDAFVRDRACALAGDDADVDAVVELYRSELGAGDDVESRRAVASALVTDFHFAAPTEQLTRAHAARGNPVFRYEVQWPSPRPGLGACHDMCLPLVFGTMDRVPGLAGTGAEVEHMSAVVQDAWIAFIRTGDPGWPASTPDRRATMLLGPDPHVVADHRAARLAVWEGRYPASG